jgi:hypothetical protein
VPKRAALPLFVVALGCGGSSPTPLGDAPVVVPTRDAAVAPDGAARDVDYPITLPAWPGDSTVSVASAKDAFGANLSGLGYEPAVPAVLWAVQNEPSKLYRLYWDGSAFAPVASDGWVTGKSLRYPNGKGSPDGEGLTRTDFSSAEMYVVAERDNDDKDDPRQSILRYDLSGTKGILDATHEWNLTSDLPACESNSGLEGIAWIPDSFLVASGFVDESKQAVYDPTAYPNHGTGIFLVGVDVTGMIYGYVLGLADGAFTRVASFSSHQARSVDLFFDRDNATLWSLCDKACDGQMTLFAIETGSAAPERGRFVLRAVVPPPKSLKDMNNEGFTAVPDGECSNGRKSCFWADDGATGGYAIRRGTIACGGLF